MDELIAQRVVLVVQSNCEHIARIQTVFAESDLSHQLVSLPDGKQALDFLHQRGDYQSAPRPDLILLELDLPGTDGREILAEVKTAPKLRRIPIVVLALSDRDEDIFKIYSLQGNCYVVKSSDLDQLSQTIKRIEEFWLGIVTLPVE